MAVHNLLLMLTVPTLKVSKHDYVIEYFAVRYNGHLFMQFLN